MDNGPFHDGLNYQKWWFFTSQSVKQPDVTTPGKKRLGSGDPNSSPTSARMREIAFVVKAYFLGVKNKDIYLSSGYVYIYIYVCKSVSRE